MNIVVLAGGTSTERDISISTGINVAKSLKRDGHNVNLIDVFLGTDKYNSAEEFFNEDNDFDKLEEYLKSRTKDIPQLAEERTKKGKAFFGPSVLDFCGASDIVFMGLHGSNGEDGKIQGTFDLLGIKYTGTGYLSSAISMDKELTKKVLVSEGI